MDAKERFIGAWTEKCLHFGNRASSRAEGAHSKLKHYLQVSTGDLRTVKTKLFNAIKNEFEEIKTRLLSERLRTSHSSNIYFFKEHNKNVSMFAMEGLLKQYELMRLGKMHSKCTDQFTLTGLPCSHRMLHFKDTMLPLTSIHSQWRIDTRSLTGKGCDNNEESEFQGLLNEFQQQYAHWPLVQKEDALEQISSLMGTSSSPLLLQPNIQIHKGRQSKKRKGSTSTRRDPSKSEIVEATQVCSLCKGVGHNRLTCQPQMEVNEPNHTHVAIFDNSEFLMGMPDSNTMPCSTNSFLRE